METVRLNGTGIEVTRVALGGCPLGAHGWGSVDDDESIGAVKRALDLGVNFFDTADVYGLGHSERLLARALGRHRHRVVIATKFGVRHVGNGRFVKNASARYLREALEGSLRRLRIDCIPLYYVHWPDGKTPIEETLQALEACRRQGKIGAIGLSNFSPDEFCRACDVTTVSAVQVQYSLAHREAAEKLLPVAAARGVPLVTWGSLAQGLLTGKMDAATSFERDDRRSRYEAFQGDAFQQNLTLAEQLNARASAMGRTAAQLALRWLLDTPGVGCALFGAKRSSQVEENAKAGLAWRLPAADYREFDLLSANRVKGAAA